MATDAGIGGDAAAKKKTEESAEDVFELVVSAVNDAPEASAVPDKTVDEDATVTYQVLPFTDEDDDTTSASFKYVAQLVSSGTPGALPSWIKFDADSSSATFRTFTFTPSDSSHVGDHTLRVTGTDDGGKSDFVDFKVTVAEVNDVPKKPVAGLADPDDVDEDTSSTYKFDAFTDEETSALTYTFSVVRVVGNVKTDMYSHVDHAGLHDADIYVCSDVEFGCRDVRGDGCGDGRGHWRRRCRQEEDRGEC